MGPALILKRAFDATTAVVLIALLLPLMAVVAALLRTCQGRPVLFVHRRAGRAGRVFTLYKFRTMVAPQPGESFPDAARLTPIGAWLRAWSLDELPQLWHVLRGDMALVGPRPLPPEYLSRYTPEQARRHEVKPGITGLVQVSGRNALAWEEKFALDVWYVDHQSLRLDLWILWRTLVAVVRRDGIAAAGHATMPEFHGRADTAEGGPRCVTL
jgi:lipopolysaccharide/colanic/teichoic acid biosynthesis glycosyltransferase